jgi:hypothetical protein
MVYELDIDIRSKFWGEKKFSIKREPGPSAALAIGRNIVL